MTFERAIIARDEHHVVEGRHLQVQHLLVEWPDNSAPLLSLVNADKVLFCFFVHDGYKVEVLSVWHNAAIKCHAHGQYRVLHLALSGKDLNVAIEAHSHERQASGVVGQG